jgi:glycosyltransferase involved in cell wall biosynthesis
MLLSVVIPSYNHRDFVLKTIRAASLIPIDDKEIIVIDDGSKDDSAAIIENFISSSPKHQNIRLIARNNRGLVRTLNEGLTLSSGKYLYGVASDDIPIPEGIAELVKILERNDRLKFVLGNALFMESEQQEEFLPTYGAAHRRFFGLPWKVRRREMFLHYPQPILLQGTVFRLAALKDVGAWREDLMLDDMSLFLRLFLANGEASGAFEFCPEVFTCFYRMHATNASKNLERQFAMVEEVILELCPPDLLEAAILRNLADHSTRAIRDRNPKAAWRMVRSSLRHASTLRIAMAGFSELRDTLSVGRSRYRASKLRPIVSHSSAASGLKDA